jgi:class 3 adenylate cyclase
MSVATSIEATFCFVDMAGYTALIDTHGELAAADLIDDFRELIQTSVESSGHLQSLIGDCAFLKFPTHLLPQKHYQSSTNQICPRTC